MKLLRVLSLVIALATPTVAEATIVLADGFPHLADCGAGAQEVYGYHWAVLNSVDAEDQSKVWRLQGTVITCGFVPTNQGDCLTSALGTQNYLSCNNLNVKKCNRVRAGIKIRSWAFFPNEENDSFVSNCTPPPECTIGPGPRDWNDAGLSFDSPPSPPGP